MPSFRPLIIALILSIALSGLWRWQLQRLMPRWWTTDALRRGSRVIQLLTPILVLMWSLGTWSQVRPVALVGAVLSAMSIGVLLTLVLATPLAWLWEHAAHLLLRVPRQAQGDALVPPAPLVPLAGVSNSTAPEVPEMAAMPPALAVPAHAPPPLPPESVMQESERPSSHLSRRRFIELSTGAVPLVALASGSSGVVMAAQPQHMPLIEMKWPDLPPALEGLKILHLSDIHLGMFIKVKDIEEALVRAQAMAPDLILITGDVTDDVRLLAPALELINQFRPRLGAFAAIGNHEYFRGFDEIRRIYDRSQVPLLLEQSTRISVGEGSLFLGGVNDPVWLRGSHLDFMARTFDKTLEGAASDAFRIVMSHRPDGFVAASERGVHLTLSGHTHGGQLGRNGRSVFEGMAPERFLWGPYKRGTSQLYTSAGFGHWLPVRIGCPAEAPIIVLRRG